MVGCENLVREALRKYVDLLRDNKLPNYHYDAGVILSHQKKDELLYVLEQKEFKFGSDRYNNFCFRSPKCLKQIKNNDDLLCNKCDDIVLKLQNNCLRSEKRVEASKKVNFRHDIALSSPTLAQNKMEMLSQNIRLDTMKKARAKFIH